ncbi:MAG: SPFH domain-containing protein [Candidatus ainarchaeum sp.]|nr:SPFH domain-containing protein [Candidatus ainarchaeum sp.]
MEFKYVVFGIILIAISIIAVLFFLNLKFLLSHGLIYYLIWIIIGAVFLFIAAKSFVQLMDYQRAVIYRFGKFSRVKGPGLTFVLVGVESYSLVDLRVKTIDVPKQDVVTKDRIELSVDTVIYLKVNKDAQSVVNSVVEVEDYVNASCLFVISSIRDVMGSMNLSEIISNIELINAHVKNSLEKISKHWGISVESVEIKDVQIPETVINAMHEEKAAVQQKLARMEKALAHKAEIEAVKEATTNLDDKALAYYYIKAIENMSNGKGNKVFFPAEFTKIADSLTNMVPSKKAELSQEYKDLLKEYIDKSVSKAKKSKK